MNHKLCEDISFQCSYTWLPTHNYTGSFAGKANDIGFKKLTSLCFHKQHRNDAAMVFEVFDGNLFKSY